MEPTRFTETTFRKIRPGMTRAEVCALLGNPPGDYHKGLIVITDDCFPHVMEFDAAERAQERIELWIDDEGIISVWFDASGRVINKRYQQFGEQEGKVW